MSVWQKAKDTLSKDNLLRQVLKNSSALLGSNVITALFGFANTVMVSRLLGPAGYGLVSGVIITFASNINRFLTFRMSEVVVQRLNAGLRAGKQAEAAVAVKTAMLTEAATSILAYLILLLLTPWVTTHLARSAQAGPLIMLYGVILLTNLIAESSTGVLQAQRRFGWIARINVIQGLFTSAIILGAILFQGGITQIVMAYAIGKSINGISLAVLALIELGRTLGDRWWKTPFKNLPDKRGMFMFMLNTNLNGTINLFTRDNIPLYLAYILSATHAGYFKLALSLINLILLPLDPLIWPTYTEITRTIAQKQWAITRQLLKRVSLITGSVVLMVGGFLALSGWFLLPFLYGKLALPAYPALLILLIGYGFASVFQWNRPLLLALGKPEYPLMVSLVGGLVELTLIFSLVPRLGYLALAAILSAYFVFSIGITVWRGLAEINHLAALDSAPDGAAGR